MSLPPNLGPRNGILSLTIKDKSVLYAAYMPFIKNGGLFIPTNKNYKLGDEVFMLLNLMDEPEKIPVAGKVVWITPKGAQGHPRRGCRRAVQRWRQQRQQQDRNLPGRCADLGSPDPHDVIAVSDKPSAASWKRQALSLWLGVCGLKLEAPMLID